jgi:hypothetical protein
MDLVPADWLTIAALSALLAVNVACGWRAFRSRRKAGAAPSSWPELEDRAAATLAEAARRAA